MNNQDLPARAMAAYYRSADTSFGSIVQPSTPDEITINGLDYVVLSNVNGILAVYRVKMQKGKQVLSRMKRWPKELTAHFE